MRNERKISEETFQQTASLLAAALESTADGLLVIDNSRKINLLNNKFLSMWHIPESLAAKRDDNVLLESVLSQLKDPDAFIEKINQLYSQPEANSFDVLEFKDGRVFERFSQPQRLGSETVGRVWSFRDVTDRRRAEEAQRLSHETAERLAREKSLIAEIGRLISSTLDINEVYERFAAEVRKLIPFDRIAINLCDVPRNAIRIAYVSGAIINGRRPGDSPVLAGTLSAEIMRTRTGMLIQSENADEIVERFPPLAGTFQTGLLSLMGVPLIYRNEAIGVLHFRAKKSNAYTEQDLRLAERIGGQIAGAIAVAQLYQELKETETSLRESESRFRTLVEQAAVGVAEIEMSTGQFLTVNRRLCEMVGRTEEELLATTFQAITHPEDLHLHEVKTALLFAGKIDHYSLEKRYLRKDGAVIWVEVTVSPLWKPEEEPGRNMIVVEDITERKQSEEELRRSQDIAERLAQEMAVIAEIGKVVGATIEIEEVYERFAAEVRKLIPFDRLAVNLHDLDRDMVSIVYSSGENIPGRYPGDSFPLKDSVSEVLVRTKAGIFSHPTSIEEMDKQFPNHSATIQAGMRSLLSVPLISRDKVIASLHFRSRKPDAYSDTDLRLAERIGEQIAGAIANGQLFKDLSKTEKTLRASEEEQRRLIETLPLAVFVETHGKIAYINPAFLTLFKASSPNEVIGIRLIEFVSPELYDTIEKRRRIMTEEKCVLPPLEQNLRCMDGTFITVVSTSMPFIFQGQPAILTALYDITERKRSEIELGKAYKLLKIHAREIEDLQARLKEQAIRDPLTGLFNRRYLEGTMERELARASREGFPISVVMIDIDRFKQVNDSHGHKAGDLVLQAMGKILLSVIRAGDIACRYGGEEFLLILPQASKAITAERAEELRIDFQALRTAYGKKVLQTTISLGIATYPADGVTAEAVIHAADQAMFRAKALGRNRVVLS